MLLLLVWLKNWRFRELSWYYKATTTSYTFRMQNARMQHCPNVHEDPHPRPSPVRRMFTWSASINPLITRARGVGAWSA
jgi:hypothetical protein